MRSATGTLLAAAVLLGTVAGCASLPLDHAWIEVRSESFVLYSNAGRERAEALARELELFRASVERFTNADAAPAPIPMRIFHFGSSRSYAVFRPGRNVAGYFSSTLRADFLTFVESRAADEVLRHEYTHFLMANASTRLYPRWYAEGFASFLSTLRREDDVVAFGRVPELRICDLSTGQWMPMDRVLTYDGSHDWSDHEVGLFYTQSWLLVHYLTRDAAGRAALGDGIRTYSQRIEAGADVDEAFRAAFGTSVADLDAALRRYARGPFPALGVPVDTFEWSAETRVRRLPRAEVAERLGALALAIGLDERARSSFAAALTEAPERARAHAGMGTALARLGEREGAERHLARALELDPDDPLTPLDAGAYWLETAAAETDADRRDALLRRARRHFTRSWQLDDTQPEPYARYGTTFLVDGEDAQHAIAPLERALSLLPGSVDVQLALAEAYGAVERDDDARTLLLRIQAWAHGEGTKRARELLQQIGRGDRTGAPVVSDHRASP